MTSDRGTYQPAVPGWPDVAIAEIAGRQQTIVTFAQLRALGVSSSAIDRAYRRGRLHRVHRGAYSLVPPRVRPPLAAAFAAILVTGPTAVLSHHSAAFLHGFELAPMLGTEGLGAIVDRALRRTGRTKLLEAAGRHRGRPGTARVMALLDPARPSAEAWSAAERRLLAMLRRAGLPAPEGNVAIGRYIPDLLWREQMVIVEYDSELHSGPAAVRWDTARHNHFTSLRYAVLHVTYEELSRRPERVLAQVAAALALGAR